MRTLLLLCLASLSAYAQPDTLLSRFQTPPPEARPRTWWHWVGGNVTKEGITKDLEWMKRAGIGGFQAFDVSLGMGQSVDNKLVFMSPAWLDAIQHTAAEAERLGLEMTMVTSAGWSETGGPWVKPEEAMKKIVWSEVPLTGGKSVSIQLPNPPRTTGPIRNLKRPAGFGGTAGPEPTLYEDIAVVAFPTPPAEIKPPIIPVVTSALGKANADALFDDDLQSGFDLPMPSVENPVWIQFDYGKQVTMQHFSLALALTNSFGSKDMCAGAVQYSSDGTHFTTLLSLPGSQHDIRAIPVRTYSFPAVTARYFRIIFEKGSGLTTVGEFGSPGFFGPAPSKLTVTEARFGEGARVHRWEDKAHFAPMFDLESLPTPKATTEGFIYANKVVDVTQFVDAPGKLVWQAPSGDWTIMRFGYSLTGAKNSPAMPAGVGLEVDKLSRKHLTSYYKAYTEPIANALGKLYGKRLQYWLTDSFEADAQNWTEEMPQQFVKRRGTP